MNDTKEVSKFEFFSVYLTRSKFSAGAWCAWGGYAIAAGLMESVPWYIDVLLLALILLSFVITQKIANIQPVFMIGSLFVIGKYEQSFQSIIVAAFIIWCVLYFLATRLMSDLKNGKVIISPLGTFMRPKQ